MKKKKEEMRDFLQIMSLDGSRLFGKKSSPLLRTESLTEGSFRVFWITASIL